MTTTSLTGAAAAAQLVASREQITATFTRAATEPAPATEDDRTITGLGMPYGQVIEHAFGRETFDPGSLEGADEALILWAHRRDEPIGRVTSTEDDEAGLSITARLSSTSRANDALALVRDGVVTGLSVGFEPIEFRVEVDEAGVETIHWTRVVAREFSLVAFPAYEARTRSAHEDARTRAALTRTPAHPTPERTPRMDPDETTAALTRADLTPLTEQMDDLQRAVQLGATTTAPSVYDEAARFGSIGGFVRALATGDESAQEFYQRAFAGPTTDDVAAITDHDGTGWLGTIIRMVEDRRSIARLFSTAPLPADGLRVDYAQYAGDTLKVGKQSAQGANLPGPGGLVFTNESDPVETYGGWTELPRQLIERTSIPYLDTVYRAMAIKYARETDAAVRDRALAEVAGIIAAGVEGTTIAVDPLDPFAWLDAVIDAGDRYAETGFSLTGLAVDKATFKSLVRLPGDDGRPLLSVYGTGYNTVGEMNLPASEGNLARVPVKIAHGAPAGTGFFFDPLAIELREAPGAPFRLQDDNIINLTRAFSLYGYAAVTAPFPTALVPLTFGTEPAGA